MILSPLLMAALQQETEAGNPRVRIVAYINESSGCQETTVSFLKSYTRKKGGAASLEIVDFGSEAGFARWRNDGHHCETLVINGASQFRLGAGGASRMVVFKMPEGVRWTFEDLSAVLAQELKSPGSSVLSDAKAMELAKRTPFASRRSKRDGKAVGEVIVAAQTVFRFASPLNGKSAVKRAEEAASALKKQYAAGLLAEEVKVVPCNLGGQMAGLIMARSQPVAVVGKAEADLIKRASVQAAQFWAFNLRDALRLLGR